AKGWFKGTDGVRDQITSIEGIRGTNRIDKVIGDHHINSFRGLDGADVLKGGGGTDWTIYDQDARFGGSAGVRVDLGGGFAIDGFGARDRLVSVEAAVGTQSGDTFIDNGGNNTFYGLGGDDSFQLSQGTDTLYGGTGADTFTFVGPDFGADTIGDFEDGTDMLEIADAPGFAALTISVDGADMLIEWNGNSIRLLGQAGATIDANDFFFP
ncbi:MAG: hypothetical protein D6801_08885, partial [Alphaproteobacteria bacterium]